MVKNKNLLTRCSTLVFSFLILGLIVISPILNNIVHFFNSEITINIINYFVIIGLYFIVSLSCYITFSVFILLVSWING
jgi:hypothetical protein